MKHPAAYKGRKVWKTKDGWNAQIYVVAYVRCRKTKAQAVDDLESLVREMECGDQKCCGTHTANTANTVIVTSEDSKYAE